MTRKIKISSVDPKSIMVYVLLCQYCLIDLVNSFWCSGCIILTLLLCSSNFNIIFCTRTRRDYIISYGFIITIVYILANVLLSANVSYICNWCTYKNKLYVGIIRIIRIINIYIYIYVFSSTTTCKYNRRKRIRSPGSRVLFSSSVCYVNVFKQINYDLAYIYSMQNE